MFLWFELKTTNNSFFRVSFVLYKYFDSSKN